MCALRAGGGAYKHESEDKVAALFATPATVTQYRGEMPTATYLISVRRRSRAARCGAFAGEQRNAI